MALALTTITDSISKLSVTGLTIKDIDEIPEAWDARGPVLYPEPRDFVTNFNAELATFGQAAGSRSWNIEYDLNYVLLYAPVGAGRGAGEQFKSTITLAFQVIDAILANTFAGAVTLKFGSLSTPAPVPDVAGNMFYGVTMTFHVLEFVN